MIEIDGERTFRRLVEAAPDAVVIVNGDGRVVLVNSQVERLFGYRRDELLGRPVEILLPEHQRAAHIAHRAAFLDDRRTRPMGVGLELAGRRKDGNTFSVEISLSPLETEDGFLVMSAIRDITERKQVERRFRELLESAPDAVVIVARDGKIVLVNTETETMFGYRRAELLGQPVELLLPERVRATHTRHRLGYVADPRTRPMGVGMELAARRKDGSEFPVEISLSSLGTGEGLLVTSVIRDISDRKRTEDERARLLVRERDARRDAEAQHARLETILASVTHGVIFVDGGTGRLSVNPAATRLLGQPGGPDDEAAQYTASLRRPDGRALTVEELPSSRALRGEAVTDEELVVMRAGIAPVPVLVGAAPVRQAGGEQLGAVLVLQNITALKDLERLREEWTSVIAHDLRQPVTAIAANASLLQLLWERRPYREEDAEALAHITSAAHSLNRMIGDLLDALRLEVKRLQLERRPADLAGLVREIIGRAAEVTRGHAVRLMVRGALPPVWIDPGRIEQVLVNLLSNAAKYGALGADIRVELAARTQAVEVAVVNRGPGISAEDLPHLFGRFFRSGGTPGIAGLGLGLYISRGLVEAHGGRIWVESAPERTTSFRFTLPLATTGKGRGASRRRQPPRRS